MPIPCSLSFGVGCLFFFQAEDGIRDADVTGVQTCALPISGLLEEEADHTVESQPRPLLQQLVSIAAVVGVVWTERPRSEEGRVGEEGRSRGAPDHLKKKK